MDIQKLTQSGRTFLLKHPKGLLTSPQDNELVEFAQKNLTPDALSSHTALNSVLKLVMEAPLVTFLKKKHFQEALESMDSIQLQDLQGAVYELLYGAQEEGFTTLVKILLPYKAGPWEVVTVLRRYCYPDTDFILKPLQVNRILTAYELEDLIYMTKPTYSFYSSYRDVLLALKREVNPSLSNNAQDFITFLDNVIPAATSR